MLTRYCFDIHYIGKNYGGWINTFNKDSSYHIKNKPGITDYLFKAFQKFAGPENVSNLRGSSRTDAGVSALCNRFHVDIAMRTKTRYNVNKDLANILPYDAETIRKAVNYYMNADDVVITDGRIVDKTTFDAVRSARSRTYMYRILCRASAKNDVLFRFHEDNLWRVEHDLDVERMRDAAQHLLGTHDFTSVRNAGCSCSTATRTVQRLDISEVQISDQSLLHQEATLLGEGKLLIIHIKANAFLYRMVRNIVGALVDVGKGKLSPDDLPNLISNKDRHALPPPAPAQGLYLMHVEYDEEKDWILNSKKQTINSSRDLRAKD